MRVKIERDKCTKEMFLFDSNQIDDHADGNALTFQFVQTIDKDIDDDGSFVVTYLQDASYASALLMIGLGRTEVESLNDAIREVSRILDLAKRGKARLLKSRQI